MEEITLYTHYLSPWKGVPPRKLSENTKKIIALVESEDYLEANKFMMSDINTLQEIVYSARADVRYKLELLNGIIEEFKDTKEWDSKGKSFMEIYDTFCTAIDFMKSADNVFFTLTKVTRDKNNILYHDDNYPIFSSVDEISKYLASHFDIQKDSEDDPEWYIAKRHENIRKPSPNDRYIKWKEYYIKWKEYVIRTSAKYLLSKRGTVWKCGIDEYDEKAPYSHYCDELIGDEIDDGQFVAGYGDIIIFDRRPFFDICHMIYASDGGEEYGLYVENGKLKVFPIEYFITEFEEFAFVLRTDVQEDISKLSEQEHILLLIQQKYNSLGGDDGYYMLTDIVGRIAVYEAETGINGIPVEMVTEEFLK